MGNEMNQTGLSRRTIVKGAAWSAPVVAVAMAAPMAAAATAPEVNAGNLQARATNCDLITLNVGGSSIPGFRYLVTEGDVAKGTRIRVTAGGLASIGMGNFTTADSSGGVNEDGNASGLSLLFLTGHTAEFELLRDYAVGEWIEIGITGVDVSIVGRYSTEIMTPDTNLNDQLAAFTAGGVGVLGAIGAWICFEDTEEQKIEPANLPADVIIDSKCPTIAGGSPRFIISTKNAGIIPKGTKFLLFGNGVAQIQLGGWKWQGGAGAGDAALFDILGLNSDVRIVELPRDVAAGTPIELVFSSIGASVAANARLAYIGTDLDDSNNAAGMNFTGVNVGSVYVGSCQTV